MADINNYGTPGDALDAPSLSEWAGAVVDVLNSSNTTVNDRIGAVSLSTLPDVTVTNPQADEVLSYNGSQWVNAGTSAGVIDHGALTGLADDDHTQYGLVVVSTTEPSNPRIGTIWVDDQDLASPYPQYPSSIGVAADQYPKTDGVGGWTFTSGTGGGGSLDALTDVTITSPLDNQVLQYNAISTQWENIDSPYLDLVGGTLTGRLDVRNTSNQVQATFNSNSAGRNSEVIIDNPGVTTEYSQLRFDSGGVAKWALVTSTNTGSLRIYNYAGNKQVTFDSAGTQVSFNSMVLNSIGTPVASSDATTKSYVDNAVTQKWTMWTGNQAAYNAIITKDPNTLYVVV